MADIKRIWCLFVHHDWKFSYHHGMPRKISTDRALEMLSSGESYSVDECTRCKAQSRVLSNGTRVLLSRSEMEVP